VIRNVEELSKGMLNLYGEGFKVLGREQTFRFFMKFFVRRVLRDLEEKTGGPIEDQEERQEALEHLEEEIQRVIESTGEEYFDLGDGEEPI